MNDKKILICAAILAVLSGCCGCWSRDVVIIDRTPAPVVCPAVVPSGVVVQRPAPCHTIVGDALKASVLLVADTVGLVFPIGERTDVLRDRLYGGY